MLELPASVALPAMLGLVAFFAVLRLVVRSAVRSALKKSQEI